MKIKKMLSLGIAAMMLLAGTALPTSAATPRLAMGPVQSIYDDYGDKIGETDMWSTNGTYILNGETYTTNGYSSEESVKVRISVHLDIRDSGASNNGNRDYLDDRMLEGGSKTSYTSRVSYSLSEADEEPDYGFLRGTIDGYTSDDYYRDWAS